MEMFKYGSTFMFSGTSVHCQHENSQSWRYFETSLFFRLHKTLSK
jgi:hypothetical protein